MLNLNSLSCLVSDIHKVLQTLVQGNLEKQTYISTKQSSTNILVYPLKSFVFQPGLDSLSSLDDPELTPIFFFKTAVHFVALADLAMEIRQALTSFKVDTTKVVPFFFKKRQGFPVWPWLYQNSMQIRQALSSQIFTSLFLLSAGIKGPWPPCLASSSLPPTVILGTECQDY